jgi:hypothetical protein
MEHLHALAISGHVVSSCLLRIISARVSKKDQIYSFKVDRSHIVLLQIIWRRLY